MSVDVKDLSFSYGDRKILNNISFHAEAGEMFSILGCNGVGKSTLFRCILGLLKNYTGKVYIQQQDTSKLSHRQMAKLVAYIPQNTASAFNYSVEDIVLMGMAAGLSPLRSPKKEELEKVDWALEKCGIIHLKKRCFHHLSGGERQLVVISRALVQNAPVLMLDEPTASLDFGNQMLVWEQTRNLSNEGYTVIQTTHNPEHSYMFSDKILAIRDGSVLAFGKPDEVINEDVISRLYNIDVNVSSLYGDKVRVCIPEDFT